MFGVTYAVNLYMCIYDLFHTLLSLWQTFRFMELCVRACICMYVCTYLCMYVCIRKTSVSIIMDVRFIIFKFSTPFSDKLHSPILPLLYTSVKWQWISMDKICFAYRKHIILHTYLQDQVSTVIATAHQLILSQHLTKWISWHLLYISPATSDTSSQ